MRYSKSLQRTLKNHLTNSFAEYYNSESWNGLLWESGGSYRDTYCFSFDGKKFVAKLPKGSMYTSEKDFWKKETIEGQECNKNELNFWKQTKKRIIKNYLADIVTSFYWKGFLVLVMRCYDPPEYRRFGYVGEGEEGLSSFLSYNRHHQQISKMRDIVGVDDLHSGNFVAHSRTKKIKVFDYAGTPNSTYNSSYYDDYYSSTPYS